MSGSKKPTDPADPLTPRQHAAVAALLSERTHALAAEKAEVAQ